ncbi:hypothetical protein [Enemella sp. A6]|uniref:hypothetical protein n=1 Tax=Enemella sp. A6 TaxID=3440152 RepID=UPI003EBF3AEB
MATSLRGFAERVDKGGFDVGLRWEPPGFPTVETLFTADEARSLAASIRAHDLETTEDVIVGTVKTSSASKMLEVEGQSQAEERVFSISRGALSDADIHNAAVFSRVRVVVEVTMTELPGGETKAEYVAKTLEVLPGGENPSLSI